MKTLKFALIAAVAVALAQAPVVAGRGGEQKKARKAPPVSVSGSYSGALRGTISVGSELVVIPKNVTIVDARSGRIAEGTSVSNRSLSVSGRIVDGKLVAGFIVVGAPVSGKDFSEQTLPNAEADPDRAR